MKIHSSHSSDNGNSKKAWIQFSVNQDIDFDHFVNLKVDSAKLNLLDNCVTENSVTSEDLSCTLDNW